MKISSALLTLLPCLALAAKAPAARSLNNGNGNGNGKNGKGPTDLPPQAQVPHHVFAMFRESNMLRESWTPDVQHVPRGASSFSIGGDTIPVDDLKPLEGLFAAGSQLIVDGVRQAHRSMLLQSETIPGVHVIMDEDQKILKATRSTPSGNLLDLMNLYGDAYAEVNPVQDIDESLTVAIDEGALEAPEEVRRMLRNPSLRRRRAQVGDDCSTVARAKIDFGVDSDFVSYAQADCDEYGTCGTFSNAHEAAYAALQAVFVRVREDFLAESCILLEMGDTDIKTRTRGDVYRQLKVDNNYNVCNTLNDLRLYLNANNPQDAVSPASERRAIFHMIYGDGQGWTKGCAYLEAICTANGIGLSELAWPYSGNSGVMIFREKLLKHELAHTFGALHIDNGSNDNVMYPSINGDDTPFKDKSIQQMKDCVNGVNCWSTSCLTFVGDDGATTTTTPAPPSLKPSVELWLVDADQDVELQPLGNYHIVDLADLPFFSFKAKPSGSAAPVGRVEFFLDGQSFRTERSAPFMFAGDTNSGNNYYPWEGVTPGTYEVSAIPYDASTGGTAGDEVSVTLTVTDDSGSPNTSSCTTGNCVDLILVDAVTNNDIGPITGGSVTVAGSNDITIRAEPAQGTVNSVEWYIDGTYFRRENAAPFMLNGDKNDNMYAWNPSPSSGTFEIKAVPFTAKSGGGDEGDHEIILITFP